MYFPDASMTFSIDQYHQIVGQHFQLPGHKVEHCTMIPIVKMKSNNVWVRKALERKFIKDHDLIDSGINFNL